MWILKYLDAANFITGCNVLLGVFAVFAAANNDLVLAYVMVIACVAVDHLDGYIARRFNPDNLEARKFGGSFDMVADLVAFSIAPALFVVVMMEFAYTAVAGASLYALCGALRLVRFEIEEQTVLGRYSGLPTTYAAYVLSVSGLLSVLFQLDPQIILVLSIVLALLQVANFVVRKPPLFVTAALMPFIGFVLFGIIKFFH